jgi:hypothetical protein
MAELAPFKPAEDCETRDKAQSALAMAFPAFPYNSPDRYALTVAGALLSGLAGRLFHELRDKRSLAYTVAAMPWLRKRAGAMIGYVATSPEREGEARDTMLRELYSLSRDEITTDELDRARNYAAGMAEVRQQSGGAVAGEIMAAWLHGTLEELPEVPARLRAVTAEDVARVARDVFQPDQRAEFVIRGTGKSKKWIGRGGGRVSRRLGTGLPGQNIDIARNERRLSFVMRNRSQSNFTTDRSILYAISRWKSSSISKSDREMVSSLQSVLAMASVERVERSNTAISPKQAAGLSTARASSPDPGT